MASLRVKILVAVISVCVNVPTVHPAVPANVTAALGRVNVPVAVSKELIVSVKAAVRVTWFQLTGSVSSVQEEAIESVEPVVVIVPDKWVSVGVPLAA